MDLMRLLRSLEEFLYELVGWLVFYPRTFWRILRDPAGMAGYTVAELQQPEDRQFDDTISPVLMLILSVVLAHALEMVSRVSMPQPGTAVGQLLFGSEQGLLLSRSVVFCGYALVAALVTLRQRRLPVTRDTLREPFSVQAFLVSPFVVLLAVGVLATRAWPAGAGHAAGLAIALLSCAWYVAARTAAYRAVTGDPLLSSLLRVLAGFAVTTVAVLALGAAILL